MKYSGILKLLKKFNLTRLIIGTFRDVAELNTDLTSRVHVTWNVLRVNTAYDVTKEEIYSIIIKLNLHRRLKVIKDMSYEEIMCKDILIPLIGLYKINKE